MTALGTNGFWSFYSRNGQKDKVDLSKTTIYKLILSECKYKHLDYVAALIPSEDTRLAVERLLTAYQDMRKVYRSNKPLKIYLKKDASYKL